MVNIDFKQPLPAGDADESINGRQIIRLPFSVSSHSQKGHDPKKPGKPIEDRINVDTNAGIFCLADGISRSVTPGMAYPDPSPSAAAAEIFTTDTVSTLVNILGVGIYEDREYAMLHAAMQANEKIAGINSQKTTPVDIIRNDLAGCVAAIGHISGTIFHYLSVGDTGIYHLRDSELFRINENQTKVFEDWRRYEGYGRSPKADKIIRILNKRLYRNNPANEYGFGVFTGESKVKHFIRTGSFEIRPGDAVIIASDGLEEFFAGAVKDSGKQQLIREGEAETIVMELQAKELEEKVKGDDKSIIIVNIGSL